MALTIPAEAALLTATPAADLDRRFGGLARLYGAAGARRIRTAHVVVVGLGGVGSWAAEALARSGVGQLTLIDLDHISESNINRQIHALDGTLGQSKVEAMRERIALIHPECVVNCIEEFVEPGNWPQLAGLTLAQDKLFGVIDACDQVKAKVAMAAWAMEQRVHFIGVGAAGGKRHAHKVDIDDLALTTHDPLLAQLRYRLRKHHGAARKGKIGLACVFSREAVMQPDSLPKSPPESICLLDPDADMLEAIDASAAIDGSLNCHGYGSVVSVTSTFGVCAAGWLLDKFASQR
jgi:tRNA A37 threonylcarbamoyladenosine dehydratase